jgi:citrate synthase
MNWIPADDVLTALNVQRQSLYAYVSRGLIRARPDPDDPRRSLYAESDVKVLAGRRRGARRRSDVAAGAIAWGEPVLESAISTVRNGDLLLRGRSIGDLAERSTLEDVALLLWRMKARPSQEKQKRRARPIGPTAKARAFIYLASRAGGDPPGHGRSLQAIQRDSWDLLSEFADALTGESGRGEIHERLAESWGLDARRASLVRRALVLMSDHELNPSTFAVRIAASTGASPAACALAGLSTLAGPLHGEAAMRALGLLDRLCVAPDPGGAVRAMITRGEAMAGFRHPLYPDGDIRALNLLAALRPRGRIRKALAAIESETGDHPNCDAALAAMTRELGLPDEAPFVIFALGRMAGWLAHAMEQRETGRIIRPRARYVGG